MRGVGIAIVLAMGGCSGRGASSTTASSPGAEEPPAAPDPFVLPAFVPGPAYELQCQDFPKAKQAQPAKRYDFSPTPLPLGTDGPRFADRSRAGYARTVLNVRDAVARRQEALEACWTWASSATKTPTETLLRVAFDVDPWGAISAVTATGPDDAADLRACVEQAVSGSRASGVATRRTHADVAVRFIVEDGTPPKKRPKKPKAPAALASPLHGHLCAPVLTDAPVDTLVVDDPLDVWGGRAASTQRVQPLSIAVCTPGPTPDLDKRAITGAVRGNAAVFGACHADARERDPQLAGALVVELAFDRAGGVTVTKLDGDGDAALHACVKAGFEELWFHPASSIPVEATWTWTLTPPETAASDELRKLQAQLTAERHGLASCHARRGVLEAMLEVAPWRDDARVTAALAALVTEAATLDADAARACLEPAEIRRLLPLASATGGRERVEMMRIVWPVVDVIDWGYDLEDVKLDHARALAMYDLAAGIAIADEVAASADPENEWPKQLADELRAGQVFSGEQCVGELY